MTDFVKSNAAGLSSVAGYLPVVIGVCTAVMSVKSSEEKGLGCGSTSTRVVGGTGAAVASECFRLLLCCCGRWCSVWLTCWNVVTACGYDEVFVFRCVLGLCTGLGMFCCRWCDVGVCRVVRCGTVRWCVCVGWVWCCSLALVIGWIVV